MKNLCNLLIVAELQIIIKAVFAKLFLMLALLLTLCANKVCNTQSETFNDTKITSSRRRNGIHELLNLNSAISSAAGSLLPLKQLDQHAISQTKCHSVITSSPTLKKNYTTFFLLSFPGKCRQYQ